MKLSQSSLALLEDTLKKAIGKYTCGCEQTIVTDIHLQPNQNSGELSIFDDEDEEDFIFIRSSGMSCGNAVDSFCG